MKRLEKLVKNEIPFAVMKYYETLKVEKNITNRVYELILLDKPQKNLLFFKLDNHDINFLRKNKHLFESKNKTSDGEVFEFNNFQEIYKNALK
jgi:hypothetical protein